MVKSRRLGWTGAWGGGVKSANKILFGKPERKRLLGSPRRGWIAVLNESYRNKLRGCGLV
jgi:hypothetical protein